jgi:hypothetical protein
VDPNSGRTYYEDIVNGATQWEQPTKAAEKPPPPPPPPPQSENRGRGQSQRGRYRGRGRGNQTNPPRFSHHGNSYGGNDVVKDSRVSKPTHFIKREPDSTHLIKPEPDSDLLNDRYTARMLPCYRSSLQLVSAAFLLCSWFSCGSSLQLVLAVVSSTSLFYAAY